MRSKINFPQTSKNKSHLTAKSRKKISIPMLYLYRQNLLKGKMLDYGCGKGFDANYFKMDKYDPYYAPLVPTDKYDTITCHYVLNVVEKEVEKEIINKIEKLLKHDGIAYYTVRKDIKIVGYTSKHTLQRNVFLPYPIIKSNSSFCIYKFRKGLNFDEI